MSISTDYLDALKLKLEERYLAAPPVNATVGTIKVGSFQSEPEGQPAVITLHTSHPENSEQPHWSMIMDQGQLGAQIGAGRHRVWGAYQEIGGGGFLWYYWWARMQYYMNRQGLDQDTARGRADELLRWLTKEVNNATPSALAVTTVDYETLMETKVIEGNLREAGGTTRSYIWHGLLKIQGLVFRE